MKGGIPKVESLTKFFIVLLLKEKPEHGYNIIKNIERRIGKKISSSQVYPFLKELENKEYIVLKNKGGRDRETYELTKSGKKFVESLNRKFSNIIELAVKDHIFVCAHCGCEIYSGGVSKVVKGKKEHYCCDACANVFLQVQ